MLLGSYKVQGMEFYSLFMDMTFSFIAFFLRNIFFVVHYKFTPVNEWCICHCSRKFCFVGKSEHNNPVLSVKEVSKQKSVLILLIVIADIT